MGRLTIVNQGPAKIRIRKDGYTEKRRTWVTQCKCGIIRTFREGGLIRGISDICTCSKLCSKKPGLYAIWSAMKSRCLNETHENFVNYGGRGITVCPEWQMSFEAFIRDMGERPSKAHSLDRIDNNGNYEPGNCRWATKKEQASNQRKNLNFTMGGQLKNLADLAAASGINPSTLYARIVTNGWPLQKAMSTPVDTRYATKKKRAKMVNTLTKR